MLARYKRLQLVVVGWNAKRKVIVFFGHVTEQASGWSQTVERLKHTPYAKTKLSLFA
jgi:hypothetical protein